MATMVERPSHRPTNAYKASLRTIDEDDYRQLERGCIQAILTGSTSIIIAVDYTASFPEDFPVTRKIFKEGLVNRCVFNAKDVLKWMNARGYSDITTKELGIAIRKYNSEALEEFLNLGEYDDVPTSVS